MRQWLLPDPFAQDEDIPRWLRLTLRVSLTTLILCSGTTVVLLVALLVTAAFF